MGMDPDDLESLDDDQQPAPPQDNAVIRELRQKAKRLKTIEPEYERLKQFEEQVETEKRVGKAAEVFSQTGLSPKLAPLFLKEHEGEVTEAAALAWAQNYDLSPPPPEPEPENPRFTPTAAGQRPSELIDRATFNTWLADPTRVDDALKAYEQGRVAPL